VGNQQRTYRLSIIVVNWNGEALLKNCLEALVNQSYAPQEIIVVDNGSRDSSVRFIRGYFPKIKVIELTKNVGFSGGNLAGFKVAGGDMIALVNNDTRPDEKWLENIIGPMFEDPKVGICASKLFLDGMNKINSAGGGITSACVGFDRGYGEALSRYGISEPVFGACAAAVLYRRSMLDEIGFFDDDFFLYCEDTDLSFRAQLAGWKCVYVPSAVVHHKHHATTGKLSDLHVYYQARNLEFVWIKNIPLALMLKFAHHKLLQELLDFRHYCLKLGKWLPYLRAKKDSLKMLPRMIQKRLEIQKKKVVTDDYIKSIFTSIFSKEMKRHRAYSRSIDG